MISISSICKHLTSLTRLTSINYSFSGYRWMPQLKNLEQVSFCTFLYPSQTCLQNCRCSASAKCFPKPILILNTQDSKKTMHSICLAQKNTCSFLKKRVVFSSCDFYKNKQMTAKFSLITVKKKQNPKPTKTD